MSGVPQREAGGSMGDLEPATDRPLYGEPNDVNPRTQI